jgi:bis(5'-nucleosidyl)-tetraphosphatase
MINEFSAGFLVYRIENNIRKFLILHYPGGHFDFPKGHLEKGEYPIEAAIRELEEETGIKDIDIKKDFEEPIIYQFRRGEMIVNKTVTFYLAETKDEAVQISDEHRDYVWLEYEPAVQKVTFENARLILRKAEKLLNSLST